MPITNPIIPGFFPDPSICRVGEDYYIVNSTFEWFPGVPIHHSKDLENWKMIGHILTRESQLDLQGIPDSGGVWAPSLSHADGKFWLIYTNIRNTGKGRPFKDIRIYLSMAENILGPWTDPIHLDSIGFDPSLFHDDDGRKYLVNMEWDFRKDHYRFNGIVIQEYDPARQQLCGPRRKILNKVNILTEGPNLYKHDGWYYLMLAEGGTGWNHGISAARSRQLLGPYELDPQESVITTRHKEDWWIQKAGHGEIVETPSGEFYLVHLGSRPLDNRCCLLGRETCIQKVTWQDGWLRLVHGGVLPSEEVPSPQGHTRHAWPAVAVQDDFDVEALDFSWSALRRPIQESWASLNQRPGWLRLIGQDSLTSLHEQSLVAKRVRSHTFTAETRLQYSPTYFTQMAGLIFYYDTRSYYYLRVTHDEDRGTVLGIVQMDDGIYDERGDIEVSDWSDFYLRATVNREVLQFHASRDGRDWLQICEDLDASKISDDYGSTLRFTGAMIGICAQDLAGDRTPADFDYFSLTPEISS